MATLVKTYKGDLTTAIADALLKRIKKEDTNASQEVKDAAEELNKDDSNVLSVQDRDLGKSAVRIFQPLEGQLLKTEGKVNNLSTKVNLLAGGVADTQKLISNQNQLLEDKFDLILQNIGGISAIERKTEAESQLDRVETELEKGFDLSGTFAYEKTRTGAFGIFGKILSGILGNRYTAALVGQISKSLIPKTIRARGKLLRNATTGAIKRTAQKFVGSGVAKRVLTPFGLYGGKKLVSIGAKRLTALGFKDFAIERFGRFIYGKGADASLRSLMKKSLKQAGLPEPPNNVVDALINHQRRRFLEKTSTKVTKPSKFTNLEIATKGAAKKTKKFGAKTGATALNESLSNPKGPLLKVMKNKRFQKELVNKIGKEGAEKIGIKLAAGGTKGGFPIFGTGYAVIEGLVRLAMGDPEGMMLSFGSGIPAAGWGFAIIDILRDIDKDAYNKHIRPNLPVPGDANIAGFFQDAFGFAPDEYEKGNVNIKSPMLGGSNIDLISEILSVTKAFGDATGFGGAANQIISDSGLSSYSVPRFNYNFDVGQFSASKNIEGLQQSERQEELRITRKEKEENKKNDEGDEVKIGDVDQENPKNFFGAQQGREGYDNQGFDFWDWLPDNWFNKPSEDKVELKGEGGIGGKVIAQTSIMGGDASTIEFYGQQGRDRSGEPGVDFSFKDYKNNYNLFPGYVLETGLLYGKGYGNVVVVRSTDPSNGKQFDSLYSHFPDGGIAVKAGQQVGAGDLLGSVGFVSVDTPGVPQLQPNNAGNMSGWHTSVDFFEPDSPARYSNADSLINLVVGARNSTPHGLLESLKPVTSDNETSLNSISSNTNLASTMTNMVESGSNERLMTQRKVAKKTPIVIVNNQVISNITNATSMGMKPDQQDFFEAFNLARYTV